MKVLIKKAHITDISSPHHNSIKDVFISDGVISAISDKITETADTVIEEPGIYVSIGWIDSFSHFCDPGYEHKETLQTGAAAAAAGGFTGVMVLPNTRPVVDTKAQVEYITQLSRLLPIEVMPIGAITKGAEGKELAEMYDMQHSGAQAFSDGINPVQSTGLLVKALQYVKAFNGTIIQVPDDKSIAPHGLMNEGIVSTRLGLPGKPMMAEELMVARDIKLARYANSKLHITGVTSPKSLEYIKRAKDGGISVTCAVAPGYLAFCDEDLMNYDTNLKLNLPLRTRSDMMALRTAVADGTIDCIASHHMPQDWDSKTCEFEYAKHGMIALETCYSVLKMVLPQVSEERWVQLLSTNPRKIFGLEQPTISANTTACLTLFQPAKSFEFNTSIIRSKSHNSPFIGQSFTGRAYGIINKGMMMLNQ